MVQRGRCTSYSYPYLPEKAIIGGTAPRRTTQVRVSKLIDEAHKQVRTAVNTAMVYTYYGVGRYIVEDEQQGHERVEYGKTALKKLSERLTERYGEGWSYSNLRQIRQFYMVYCNLTNTVCQIDGENRKQCCLCLRLPALPSRQGSAASQGERMDCGV